MNFYANNKQLVDQTAHVVVGALWTWLLMHWFPFGPVIAVLIILTVARELWQHDWQPEEMGPGSYLDIAAIVGGGFVGWAL